jgi:2,4-dienoyl-CoA reductase-like NADH-dependent reductase (Old Yellow Enzyme family)
MEFWSSPRRGKDESKSRLEWIVERSVGRVPVIGVGSIRTADDALRALQTGVPLIALGRELIMEPDWVQKIADGRESEIKTSLTPEDQDRLVVPDALWKAIVNAPGWFPVVREEASKL